MGGIKGVQSLNNLTAYTQDIETTRVVSERTVCYCSNFDLDAAEWFRQYSHIKTFSVSLHNKLGKSSWIQEGAFDLDLINVTKSIIRNQKFFPSIFIVFDPK